MALKEGFNYEPVLPLDEMILDFLPKEGSMFAGLYPIGETVKAMDNKAFKNQIPTSVVSARVRLMHKVGLVIQVKQPGSKTSGRSWQITEAGQRQLAAWKEAKSEQQ